MAMSDELKEQGGIADSLPDLKYGEEGILTQALDPLQLEIEDSKLVTILDDFEDEYDSFYTGKYDLFERRKRNEIYYFGRQIQNKEEEKMLKDYESRYQDNVLYEIMGTVKPLGMTRLPDLMATPGNDSDSSKLVAQEITKALDTEIKEEKNRFVLGLAYKHLPVYFTSIIKCWWSNEDDDYEFGVVHPDLIKVDWTCSTHDADDMRFVIQKVPKTVQEVGLMFPNKKEELYDALKKQGLMPGGKETWSALATVIKISECWFHEYIKRGDKTEKVWGLVWKYEDVILRKMKNPNFDYEGEKRYFAYDEMGNEDTKRGLNEGELGQILQTGQLPENVQEEQVYHNYFRQPRKPFYFMGYDQWGKQPYDETSWVEQNIPNQKSLDKRGKQVEQTLDSRGHHILAKGAVTPEEFEEIDFDEPNVDLSVEGNPSQVYSYIPPERPTTQEFEEIENIRQRMYAISHSTATRGDLATNTAATNNQMAREGDFTSADDQVADTITPAAQWMAEWSMQFIKLRYTRDHFRWIMGTAGDAVEIKLNRNMVAEGMQIKVKASGTDKLRAQNMAIDSAKMEMIDPESYYQDMNMSDPVGRTERLILWNTDKVAYWKKINNENPEDTADVIAKNLLAAPVPSPLSNPTPQAPQQQPTAMGTQNPTPTNTAAVPQLPTQPPQGVL